MAARERADTDIDEEARQDAQVEGECAETQ